MRSYSEVLADASDTVPFTEQLEIDIFIEAWCNKCLYDKRVGGCPVLLVAMLNRTPAEWKRGPLDPNLMLRRFEDQWTCTVKEPSTRPEGTPEPNPLNMAYGLQFTTR